MLRKPIILLGNVRSGTTMMQSLFSLHPDVCSWFEPRTVWMYADPSKRHDCFDEEDASIKVVRYVRKRFLQYQEENGGRRVMEKTPSNVMRIPYVRSIFPEARLLYIVRNPLSYLSSAEYKWQETITVAKTRKRLREVPKSQLHHYGLRYIRDQFNARVLGRKYVSVWGIRYPGIYEDLKTHTVEEVIAKQWAEASRRAAGQLEALPDVLQLRYEDFVADPVSRFQACLDHCELDMTLEIRETLESQIDPNRQQKWHRLAPDVLERCLPFLEDEMTRHGYDIPASSSTGQSF